jgi:hypothetical protein
MSGWNINDETEWPTSRLAHHLAQPNARHEDAFTSAVLEELRHRQLRIDAISAADALLIETKAHNVQILEQNQTHHGDILAQNDRHHGQMLEQFTRANGIMHSTHRVAVWSVVISTIAVVVAGAMPYILDRYFKETRPDAKQTLPTQAPQLEAPPATTLKTGALTNLTPMPKTVSIQTPQEQTNKPPPQTHSH